VGGYNLTYKQFGRHAILVEWPARIDQMNLMDINDFKNKIKNNQLKEIVDVINGYNSLTIIYDITIENIYNEISKLKSIYNLPKSEYNSKNYLWEIPVCYEEEFGIDLLDISIRKGISKKQIVKLHTNCTYTVFFIGFLPGFLYLGGLDKSLHLNRRADPRMNIVKGSVGIGGRQTGIYPIDSAGGWHIIGRSPISFFNVNLPQPCFAKAGDQINFKSINRTVYNQISTKVSKSEYELNKIELK
jgi:inhibitor of KinA